MVTVISFDHNERVAIMRDLDQLVMPGGRLLAVPTAKLRKFTQEQLAYYGHVRGIYQYPTTELIGFLKGLIGNRTAIEIAAGNGIVGRGLGISMTDSWLQNRPEIKLLYQLQGQPVIDYPDDVLHFDALEAVAHYKPQVVIGCWATHLHREGMEQGNMYGINEEELIEQVEVYVHIGNEKTHCHKPTLLTHKHHEIRAPFLVTRSMASEHNNIYVFEGGKPSAQR